MKLATQISAFIFFILIIISCNKEDDNGVYGTLVFKGVSEVPEQFGFLKSTQEIEKNSNASYIMHTTDLWVYIDEIWASQEMVADGLVDDFTWHKIGEGNELKSASKYLFTADHLPVGDYKSLKIVFKNHIIRKTVYQSDLSKEVDMEGSLTEAACGNNDKITQCFSKNGSFSVDKKFSIMSVGENVRGFKIKENEVTTVYWQLGSPGSQLTDCWFTWEDINGNSLYDCGVDKVHNFDCSKAGPMWTFGVDDGEENTFIPNAVSDIDGNTYNATKIGNQIWLAENLKTTQLNDGTVLRYSSEYKDSCGQVGCPDFTYELLPPLYDYPEWAPEYSNYCGYRYNWKAVETGKLCPQGWHIPSLSEWNELIAFLGENGGGKLKTVPTDPENHFKWYYVNVGATNEFDFSASPGGAEIGISTPVSLDFGNDIFAIFFSSTNEGSTMNPSIPFIYVNNHSADINIGRVGFDSFLNCRCIKD